MAANILNDAKNLFFWAFNDAEKTALVYQWFDEGMRSGYASPGGLDALMSGSKNGVQMQKMITQNPKERLEVLSLAAKCLKAGAFPSSRSRAVFSRHL
jgi:hypothetical protein